MKRLAHPFGYLLRLGTLLSAALVATGVATISAVITDNWGNSTDTRRVGNAPGSIYSGYKNSFYLVAAPDQQVLVAALNLPVGNYAIWATLNLDVSSTLARGGGAEGIECFLKAGGDFDRRFTGHNGDIVATTVVLNVAHVFTTGGQALLTCGAGTRGTIGTVIDFVKITAVSTSMLTNTAMP